MLPGPNRACEQSRGCRSQGGGCATASVVRSRNVLNGPVELGRNRADKWLAIYPICVENLMYSRSRRICSRGLPLCCSTFLLQREYTCRICWFGSLLAVSGSGVRRVVQVWSACAASQAMEPAAAASAGADVQGDTNTFKYKNKYKFKYKF